MIVSANSADVGVLERMRRVPRMFKNPFRLGGVSIGARLTACFVAIVLSMMAADVVAVWQFSRTAAPARRLNEADRTSLAVVRVHLDVDTFRDSVAALASTHDIRQFTNEAASLRQRFVEDVAQSQQLLASSRDTGQDPAIRSALETLRVTLPSQLDTTVELASAGDWPAVSLRVADQVQALIGLSSSLVEKVDREVSQERAEAIESAQRARRQLLIVLPVAALLPLLVAVALGWHATRSITGPLSELDAGTRALARSDFHHQVAIQGEDELARLGRVFNDTAKRLAALYEMLRSSEAHLRLTIDTIPAYVWSALPDGSLDFINRRWLEFSGVSLEEGLGWGWEAAVHPEDVARFVGEWRAAVTCGNAMESEARVRRADGQYRWLLIRNVPLRDEGGKIVKWYGTSTDIDDRKRAEETLREQASLLNLTHDTIFVADIQGVIKYWNRGAEEHYGWTAEQATGREVHDLLKTVFPVPLEQIKAEVMRTGRWEGELVHTKKDGTQVVVASRWSLQRGEQGAPIAILETNNDITERKQAEEALRRLNRELRAISNCNQTLLRATDEQSLLEEICRIVCAEAGYRMAWVAYAEHNEAKSVRPAAWTGAEEGYLANLGITWADTEHGRSPTGMAIRSGKTCCIQDFATDPRLAPWRESVLQHGFLSGVALPLKDEHGNAFGSLSIYSAQPNAFTLAEIRLLEELAADLAFGIVTLRSQAARQRAEQEVARLSFALDRVREAAFLADDRGHFQYVNEEACRVLGYSRAELLGMGVADIDPEFPAERWSDHWCELKAQRSLSFESRHRTRDGRTFPVEISANYLEYGGRAYNLALVRDITERKQAEEALRRSEAYLAEAQRLTHAGSWARDGKTREILYWSEEACRLFAFDPKKGLPTKDQVFERIHPEDRAKVKEASDKTFREKIDYDIEYEMVLPDGTIKHIHSLGHPVLNADGEVAEVIGTNVDITERKRAEEALRQSEAYLQEAQRLSHTASWAWDVANEKYDYWSEEMFRIYGYGPEEGPMTLPPVLRRMHPDDRDRTLASFQKSLREKVDTFGEYRIVLPDGTIKHIQTIRHPVLNDAGDLVRLVGTIADITERKRAEEALRESETRFRTFVDHAADALFIYDFEQRTIVDVNQQACEGLGYTRQELLGKTALAFHLDSDRALAESVAQRAAAGETVIDMHWHQRKDGTVFPVEAHTSQFSYGGRRFLLKIARDISDRLRAEEEREKLRQLQADLAHVNRVTTMGELTASLAHELNQPITAVITSARACLRWLNRDTPELERARAAAERIEKDGTRAAETISRVRAFYKKGAPPEPELLDVNEVACEMLELLRSEATKFSISMRTDLAAELPKVKADRVQLQQVFMNLMLNGIEAMKETRGELTIKSELGREGEVLISISDTGVGLPAEKAGQIFDAFFTTKEHGTGMGLAISRSIIESHRGRLWASANDGKGATFHFTLPSQREARA